MAKFNYFDYRERRTDKLSKDEQEDLVFDLINAFGLMNNSVDSALLLQDLLTESEIKNLAKRLRIAKLLLADQTHEQIVSEIHCSYATVGKVASWFNMGGQGLRRVIQRLPKRRKTYQPHRIPGVGYGLPQILLHYTSGALEKNEKKKLEKFLQDVGSKALIDRDIREEETLRRAAKKLKK